MIAGLTGRAGSGKDEAAALLVDGYGFTAYELTTPLKDALLTLDPLIHAQVRLRRLVEDDGWRRTLTHPAYGPTVRRYLVSMGATLRAQFGPSILVDHLRRRIAMDFGPEVLCDQAEVDVRIVIKDVRTSDEAEFVAGLGGRLLKVIRTHSSPLKNDLTDDVPDELIYGTVSSDGGADRLERQLTRLLDITSTTPTKEPRSTTRT